MVHCGRRIPHSCNSRTESIFCGADEYFYCKVVSKYNSSILMACFSQGNSACQQQEKEWIFFLAVLFSTT